MQLSVFVVTLLSAVVAARDFTLYDDVNFGGATHFENRWNDDACCIENPFNSSYQPLEMEPATYKAYLVGNLNGAGDRASSVRGLGCTTFFR